MATKPFSEIYLRQRANALCVGLSFRLEEFVDDFPTGIPRDLIEVLKAILQELQEIGERETDPGILAWICSVVEDTEPGLSDVLNWLDNAHTAQTPRGLVQLLKSAARRVAPSSDLLVAPDYELNYSILNFVPVLRELVTGLIDRKTLDRILSALPQVCYLVRFPRIERENVLNHAILGHELGHPIADTILDDFENGPVYKAQAKFVAKAIETELRKTVAAPDLKFRQNEQFDVVAGLHRRGLEELISDAVAINTFGLSAAFAFYDLFSDASLDTAPLEPDYYPPSRYRLRLMLKLLEEADQLKLVERVLSHRSVPGVWLSMSTMLSHIQGQIAARSDIAALRADPFVWIAYKWIEKTLPRALSLVKEHSKPFAFTNEAIKEDLLELIEMLFIGIPPGERGVWQKTISVDWRSSLLAGWAAKIHLVAEGKLKGSELEKGIRELSKLTLRGIEYAILRDDYGQYMKAAK